jgi:predicted nuclease with TOPRIM domain
MGDYVQVIVTLIGVLGSASIWKYMEVRLRVNKTQNDTVQFRDDLKQRVKNLEALLNDSGREKDELRQQILDLTAEVNSLRVEVEYLKKENERLKVR